MRVNQFFLLGKMICLLLVVLLAEQLQIAHAQGGFQIGLSVHLGSNASEQIRQMPVIKSTGANALRDDATWAEIEKEPGRLIIPPSLDQFVNQALQNGMRPLLILDYGNPLYDGGDKPRSDRAIKAFTRYAVFVAQHFKGRVHEYEMWNEWNGMIESKHRGTAEDYVRLIRAVYPQLKAIDPSSTLIGCVTGGLPLDWLTQVFQAGGLQYMDAVSVHPYNFKLADRTAEGWAGSMYALEHLARRYAGGHDVPLYVTEIGWPTHTGPYASTWDDEAANLAQLYLLARTMPFIKGIWWYDFRDDSANKDSQESNFGLVRSNMQPKSALYALTTVASKVRDAIKVEELAPSNAAYHAIRFSYANTSKQAIAIWTKYDNMPSNPMALNVAGASPIKMYSVNKTASNASSALSTKLNLHPAKMPIILEGTRLSLGATQ